MLTDAGLQVVAESGDAPELLAKTLAYQPDVAVVDIGLPPHNGDDGLRVAVELRHRLPAMGIVVLTQYDEPEYALELIGDRADGVGYLLKERIAKSLLISVAAVEKHVTAIFRKLNIAHDETGHRRVQAVLRFFATQRM